MRRLLVIGVGAGDPEHVTMQAINALNEVDVFFVIEKGHETDELVRLRREICERYIREPAYRIVEIADPPRDRTTPAYRMAVEDWRARRAELWERAIADELGEDGCGAFLVWGDPSLYDSTLAVLEQILARGTVAFEHQVVPGISSVQALTARHRIPLNRVGRPVQITTGRRLAEGFPDGVADVVVMLDADCSFRRLRDDGLEIHWGAYLGMDDEILVSGPLREVADEIVRRRAEARERKGWIMDAYLLRRNI
ncbi:MAG: precorrin-6A synthase (deacetylating) [Solirubrobacteraceae bacterium]